MNMISASAAASATAPLPLEHDAETAACVFTAAGLLLSHLERGQRIDAAAFSRRGILEIIRAELATRTRFVLGDAAVRDLLITEFRIQ